MQEVVIDTQHLTKKFGAFTAVDDLTCQVYKGEIFGFLGANGSGKSTTIRMLCGLLGPTSGKATVAGFDINDDPEKIKRAIGYMSQRFSLYDDLTVRENIEFFGGVYGLSKEKVKEQLAWVSEMAGLKGREDSLTRTLSGGWKQRLALGCAVLHDPTVVFLDEPTGGVDPLTRRKFWDLIMMLSERGTTVFVTTHYLDEAEYCNRIMLMHAGRLIAGGSPEELKREYIKNPVLEVESSNVVEAMTIIEREPWVLETSVFGTYLHVSTADAEEGEAKIREVLTRNNLPIVRIEKIMPSLEDVFIHLIDRETKAAEQAEGKSAQGGTS